MATSHSVQYLIYEEHSVYRRELLDRRTSSVEAESAAALLSRRSAYVVTVWEKPQAMQSNQLVSSYRAGRRTSPTGDARS